jgi:hypothetical protein
VRPRFPHRVTVRHPGPASTDQASGNARPGATVERETRAYLAQKSTTVLSASAELAAAQDTTIATYSLLVPPDVELTAKSEIVDESGAVYSVVGQPADRRGLGARVLFRAATLHLTSDLQP